MIHPSIQPDEPLAGYWPRIARWNGITANVTHNFKSKFLDRFPEKGFGESNLQKIAAIVGSTAPEIIQNHSFIPFTFAVKAKTAKNTLNRPLNVVGPRNGQFAFAVPRINAAICPICTAEAVDSKGFSVWKREHQLPGAYWCLVHECRLVVITGFSERSMMQSPSSWLKSYRMPSFDWVDKLVFSGAIRRVYELQLHLLNLRAQLDPEKLRRSAVNRAIEIGAFANYDRSEFPIRELIQDQFDQAWLMKAWPYFFREINKNSEIKDSHQLRLNDFSSQECAIVFAALWDSTEGAVAVMQKCVAVEMQASKATARRNTKPRPRTNIKIAVSSMHQRKVRPATRRSSAAGR